MDALAISLLDKLTPKRHDGVVGVLIALTLVLGALGMRLLIAPIASGLPFLTFFPAVTLVAVLGGFRAGIFSLFLSAFLASYLFFPPYQSLVWTFHRDVVWSNVIFYLEELVVIFVVEAMYRQQSRSRNTEALLHQLEDAKQEQQIAAVAFEAQEGVMITDASGTILRVNQAFTQLTGYASEELVGQTPRILKSGRHDAQFYAEMWQALTESGGTWCGEIWDRRKDGELYLKWLTIAAVRDESGTITHYVSTQTDITERVAAAHQIENLAFYDPLTQLPNRRLLQDRFRQALAASARSGKRGAVLFIDLDHFKNINDTFGHNTGDILLQQVAERLRHAVREVDTVARLGGDEFVVLLEDLGLNPLDAGKEAEHIAEALLAMLALPYQIAEMEHHSSASIGVAVFGERDAPLEALFKQADIAMYQAKKNGRNAVRFFDPQMQYVLEERAALVEELHRAVEEQQFELHYQVQCDAMGQAIGAEALIRWRHPKQGMISPLKFIPLAEETDLILPIGRWVLETACEQLIAWQSLPYARHLKLSINVSVHQLRQETFVGEVEAVLAEYAVNPSLLKLEITESMLVDNVECTIAKMNALRSGGIRFSMDDFGTGYSSLQYLKRLPLTQLKIDQAFVRDLESDENDRAIVRTIIGMAASMELNLIAEGVETEAQCDLLLAMGCQQFQGYLFGKPMPITEFDALLQRLATL